MRLLIILIATLYLLVNGCIIDNKPELNYRNCLKVEIGMTKLEVLEIMGEPDTIFSNMIEDNCLTYYYTPPALSSSGIDIMIDTNSNKVIEVICSEEN